MQYEMTSNEAYSTKAFINSILSLSFKDKHYLSRANLNRIAYIVFEEYFNETGERIISEPFDFSTLSPSLKTVNHSFCHSFEMERVNHYIEEDNEKVAFIKDPMFVKTVQKVWRETKAMPMTMMMLQIAEYRRNNHPVSVLAG